MDSQSLAITQHPAHSQLQGLGKWLEDVKETSMGSPESAAEWVRLKRVYEMVVQRLESCDPALIPIQTMEGILQSSANVVGQVSSFGSNPIPSFLIQANKYASDLLYNALLLPGTEFKKARKSMLSYMKDYAEAVERNTAELESKTEEGLNVITNLQVKVTDLQTQAQKQSAEALANAKLQNAAFVTAQNERDAAFIASEEERTSQIKAAKEELKEALDADLKRHQEDVDGLLAAKSNEADGLRTKIQTQAEELLTLLKGFKDEAEELVGLTGTLTRANAYREAAKDESRRGLVWSGVAAIALIALSAVAFRTLWTYTNGAHPSGIDWSGFSIRLYTLFSLTALAYYAGRQGEIHRNAERQNRRLFSDLASVSPFLSDLEPAKRQEIIEEIARRIFGQPETHTEPMKQSPFLSPDQLSKGWDILIEAASKTIKKV